MISNPATVTTWTGPRRRGLTDAQIEAQLAARRGQRCGYAIVLHNGPLTLVERWFVARARAGPGAVFTSFTAAEAYGLRGWGALLVG